MKFDFAFFRRRPKDPKRPQQDVSSFLENCLLLDIEARGGHIYHLGAILGDKTFEQKGHFSEGKALKELDDFAAGAAAVLGHNILAHDLPILREGAQTLQLFQKPVVDTLILSPLAFPENPYHRLVKDYKLVKDSVNDPLADARLSASLFRDQWESFRKAQESGHGRLLTFYRFCFETGEAAGELSQSGIASVFAALGAEGANPREAAEIFAGMVAENTCRTALRETIPPLFNTSGGKFALAYALAWLRVAGGNSILPPWVLHRFPLTSQILHNLRDIPCRDASCAYCRATHDPSGHLLRFFGFSHFRPKPVAENGSSLQEQIVTHGLKDRPLLAILPTGGGKSLCYQLPALERYQRRGLLTIVISPLQALMKDQVDNLANRTETPYAAALYGLLTPPERGEVLERVRLGDIAILYVAPEQLRNMGFKKAVSQREIGSWVFDEAHCLSKWGHDFRPDYLYAGRFIRQLAEEQKRPIPPVACFTATAKKDVKEEILDFFRKELGQELTLFEGGVERENLHFEVQMVKRAEKFGVIHSILAERLAQHPGGCAIVYTATRRRTKEIADYLQKQEWQAAAFHAGLNAAEKRSVQEAFLAGSIQVIAATNAFGMGIDKENVRLVLHADIPGSLESYLQEAGRAGRDLRNAECVLLYDEQDVESQFKLGALSRLSRRDIGQILRGIRRAARTPSGDVIITTGELLRDEAVETDFDANDIQADTKVKTAIAWLERANLIERNENHTRVFQGKLLVKTIEEARKRMASLNLSATQQKRWTAILQKMIEAGPRQAMSTDDLAELPEMNEPQALFNKAAPSEDTLPLTRQTVPRSTGESPKGRRASAGPRPEDISRRLLRTLHDMAEAGLIEKGVVLSAFVRHKVKDGSKEILKKVCELERGMIKVLQEESPDAAEMGWLDLSLRKLNQRLRELGFESNPEYLRELLKSLSLDGKGFAGNRGSLQYRQVFQDHYRVKLLRDWDALTATAHKRQAVAGVILDAIFSQIPEGTGPSSELLVSFATEDLVKALRSHLFLAPTLKDPLAAVDRGLLYLHEQRAVILQQGMAIFRQAMSIRLPEEVKGKRYTKGDYEPLDLHYRERIFQVHVMNEYARLGAEKIGRALELVLAYFTLDKTPFIKRYFPRQREMLERAVGQDAYRRIVDDLGNTVQLEVVTADEEANMLILAGPGSGKTRVVVHRCAALLHIHRAPPESILVLCFNHSAAVGLRRRLQELIGDEAKGVTVQTYHGIAMRLTGTSFADMAGKVRGEEIPFARLIPDAIRLLRGEQDFQGLAPDELRDRLRGNFRHILVDEYQDIDEEQYELISALTGRAEKDPESKLSILAVGDDDQNIYTWRGANVQFILRFEEDYGAKVHRLVENYRSTGHIIAAANALIEHNHDRMKRDSPIVVNETRAREPAGGVWAGIDPVAEGKVQLLAVADAAGQLAALSAEWERMRTLRGDLEWADMAVLSRSRETLTTVRALSEHLGVPVSLGLESGATPPLTRIREIHRYLGLLKEKRSEILSATEMEQLLRTLDGHDPANPWFAVLGELLQSWKDESGNTRLPVSHGIEFIYESLMERKREQRMGRGVFLSTVHGAKGMEFPHVFLLDGDWTRGKTPGEQEEERRVFYVGMTRARETLCLFERRDAFNPHVKHLKGDFLLRRAVSPSLLPPKEMLNVRYTTLTLGDIVLSYPAKYPQDHAIHKRLASLRPGSTLLPRAYENSIGLFDQEPHEKSPCLALLSKRAAARWLPELPRIKSVRVLGMLHREKTDGDEKYQRRCLTESWEIPWMEVIHSTDE